MNKPSVPFLNLRAQHDPLRGEILAAIQEVIDTNAFAGGPFVARFEDEFAQFCQTRHAVGLGSGTEALWLALLALGVGPGDEVITVPSTFMATAEAITYCRAKPVFVDIEEQTYTMDPAKLEAAITPKTKAIIPVHLYGQMADMDPIMQVAQKHKIVVIEDGAQAIGAEYKGRRAGSIARYGCLSFFPSKNLGAFGDGGMVVTNDAAAAEKLQLVRAHGSKPKYYHKIVGGNFRLDALQAAIVTVKLKHLDSWTEARQRNAARYDKLFAESGLRVASSADFPKHNPSGAFPAAGAAANAPVIYLPKVGANRHIFNQYVIRVAKRDALKTALDAKNIGTEIYYPLPMHVQECFANLGYRQGAFPQSEGAAKETLALPVYPEVTDEQARYVVDCVRDFLNS